MTATSYAPMHFGASAPQPSSSFAQDSDCGSSSGVGGSGVLKHDDASSLGSDSRDSSAPPPAVASVPPPTNVHPHLQHHMNPMSVPPPTAFTSPPPAIFMQQRHQFNANRPPPRPHFYTMTYNYDQNGCTSAPSATTTSGSTAPGSTAPSGQGLLSTGPNSNATPPGIVTNGSNAPLPNMSPMPSNGGINDIYVHVQPGETITLLAANNDDKHIKGPATIRMIGQNNATPMALPLRVPHGHLVQQILDEQGRLKHVILSPQQNTPNANAAGVSPNRGVPAVPTISKQHSAIPSTSTDLGASPKSLSPPSIPYPPQALMGTDLLMGGGAHQDMATLAAVAAAAGFPSPIGRGPWSNGVNTKRAGNVPVMPMVPGIDYSTYHGQGYIPPQAHPSFVNHINAAPSGDLADDRYDLFEEDERERLQETLDLIQPPTIVKIQAKEVELSWQELDTSEAAASGGPFPQIDASEFTYEIFVYDGTSRRPAQQYRCEVVPGSQNIMRLPRLRPNSDYSVTIRANLPSRDLYGNASTPVNFRTLPLLPEQPAAPKIGQRTPTTLNVSWRYNGNVTVTAFVIQYSKAKNDNYVVAYEGGSEFCKITHLEPATAYRVRIVARSEYGDSEPSPPTYAQTSAEQVVVVNNNNNNRVSVVPQPSTAVAYKLPPPQIIACYNRSVKLLWAPLYDPNSYTLEYSDGRMNDWRAVLDDCYNSSGNGATVNGLASNREYHFRLHVITDTGAQLRSETVSGRTRRDQYENSSYSQASSTYYDNSGAQGTGTGTTQGRDRLQAPVQIATTSIDPCTIEVSWKYPGREFDALGFVLEGSSAASPGEWKVCYRGTATRAVINDPTLTGFRVQATNLRKHTTGPWSDAYYIKRKSTPASLQSVEEPIQLATVSHQTAAAPSVVAPVASPTTIATCSTPKLYNITWSSMEVQWQVEGPLPESDSTPTLLYELQRLDVQPVIVYSGDQTQTSLDGLKPVEHVQVRARAVVLDVSGRRLEGEWSQIASACTSCAAPSAPANLRIVIDASGKASLVWDAPTELNGADVRHYVVRTTRAAEEDEDATTVNQTTKAEFPLASLVPSQSYGFTVSAVNKGGESEPSEVLNYDTPATEPEAPQELHVEALSSSELSLAWTPGSDNGSPISAYKLTVHELSADSRSASKHLVAQHQLSGDTLAFVAGKLNPQTLYELEIVAENTQGTSEAAVIRCETFAVPPDAPVLTCSQAYSNMLKLKWTPIASTAYPEPSYFYLEKENDVGTFSLVFEGEARSTKVRGLRDHAVHRFRIRSAHARGIPSQMGKWSQVYEFVTTAPPPPAPRSAPTVTESAANLFQFEWPIVKAVSTSSTSAGSNNNAGESEGEQASGSATPASSSSTSAVFYRLQIAPKADRRSVFEAWKTVYEGSCPSSTISLPPTSGTRMARVFALQRTPTGEELCSMPSAILQFTSVHAVTDSPRKRLNKAAAASSGTTGGSSTPTATASDDDMTPNHRTTLALYRSSRMSTYKRCKRFLINLRRTISERNNALATMMAFFVIALTIALLLNNLYL
uniref:Fibronectin type-III domain-containing protein n=1 Tax=Panagrellus redivivus TaxID=6233 RepID=A0A7E4ZXR2_PANRE